MADIEKRILSLDFDYKNFEKDIRSCIDLLDNFNKSLSMDGAKDGFARLEKAANDVSFKGIVDELDYVAKGFEVFADSAVESFSKVEKAANDVSFRGMNTALETVGESSAAMEKAVSDNFAKIDAEANSVDTVGVVQQLNIIIEKLEELNATILSVSGNAETVSGKAAASAENIANGINAVTGAVNAMNMSQAKAEVDDVGNHFSAMTVVAATALGTLTVQAVHAFEGLLSSITGPVIQGGFQRALDIETSHFTLQGLIKDETEVQAILADARASVDGTAYAYNSAAMAAAQFAATGLRSGEELQNTLKAIAGTAATVNGDYDSIAHIFTTVSGQGRLMGMQLTQLSYQGLNAAATISDSFNRVLHGSSTLSVGMQNHIKALVEYGESSIKNFTGSLSGVTEGDIRELVTKGVFDFETFSAIMAETFGDHAKEANKTFTGSMANIRAALARTGEMFFTELIAQNGPLVQFFNSIREAINEVNGILGPTANLFSQIATEVLGVGTSMFKAFTENGGAQAIANIADSLNNVFLAIRAGFKAAFPVDVTNLLSDLVKRFVAFTEVMKPSPETLNKIARASQGLFSVLKLLGTFLKTLVQIAWTVIKPLASALLSAAAAAGDFATYVSTAIQESGFFAVVLDFVRGVVDGVISVFQGLFEVVKAFIDGFRTGATVVDTVKTAMQSFTGVSDEVTDKIKEVKEAAEEANGPLSAMGDFFSQAGQKLLSGFDVLGDSIAKELKERGFFGFLTQLLLSSGAAAAIQFFRNLSGAIKSMSTAVQNAANSLSSFVNTISGSLGNTAQTVALSTNLKNMAAAIAALAGALWLLSLLDFEKITVGVSAITVLFAEMMVSVRMLARLAPKVFLEKNDLKNFLGLVASLVVLSVAVGLMSSAVRKLGRMSLLGVVKGLAALFAVMEMMFRMARKLSYLTGGIGKFSAQLMVLAFAVNGFAIAIRMLGTMNLGDLVKGLGSIGALLGMLYLFAKYASSLSGFNFGFTAQLLALAVALDEIAIAVRIIGSMSLVGIGKGLGSIAAILVMLKSFFTLSKPTSILRVAGSLLSLATALILMTIPLKILSGISVVGLTKGVGAIGLVLLMFSAFYQSLRKTSLIGVAGSVGGLVMALQGMVMAIKGLAKVSTANPEGVVVAITSIMAVLTMFATFFAAMERVVVDPMDLLAIAAVVGGIASVAGSIAFLSIFPWDHILASVIAITAVMAEMIAFVLIVDKLPSMKMPLKKAASFALLSASLIPMAAALAIVAMAPWNNILSAIVALTLVIADLSALMIVVNKFGIVSKGGLKALLQMSVVLIILAAGFAALGLIPMDVIVQGLIVAAAAITILLVAAGITAVTPVVTGLELLTKALLALSAAALAIGASIYLATTGIATLINAITEFITTVRVAPDQIDQLTVDTIASINAFAESIRAHHMEFFDAAWNLVRAFFEAIADGIIHAFQAGIDFIGSFFSGTVEGANQVDFGAIAYNIVVGFVNSIAGFINYVFELGQNFVSWFISGITSGFDIHSPSKVMYQYGDYVGEGFIGGVARTFKDVRRSGVKMARVFMTGYESEGLANGIEAPSLVGDASNADELADAYSKANGFAVGSYHRITETAKETADDTEKATKKAVDNIKKGTGGAKAAGSSLGSAASSGAATGTTGMEDIGASLGDNMISGLSSKMPDVQSTGYDLGNMFGLGFGQGMEDSNFLDEIFGPNDKEDLPILQGAAPVAMSVVAPAALPAYVGTSILEKAPIIAEEANRKNRQYQDMGLSSEESWRTIRARSTGSYNAPVGAATSVSATVQGINNELEKNYGAWYDLWAKKGVVNKTTDLANSVVTVAKNAVLPKMNRVMSEVGSAVTTGLQASSTPAVQTARGMLVNLFNGFSENGSYAKPKQTGTQTASTYSKAIGDGSTNAQQTAAKVALSAISGLTSKNPQFTNTGVLAIANFSRGLVNQKAKASVSGNVSNIVSLVRSKLSSGNSKYSAAGTTATNNFAGGLSLKSPLDYVRSCSNVVGQAALNVLGGRTLYNNMSSTGVYVNAGFAQGLADEVRIRNAAGAVANVTVSTLKHLFGIKSPSKVFKEIGGYCNQGFVLGLADGVSTASDTAGFYAKTVCDTMQGAIETAVDSEFELTPSITPVVDLTNVSSAGATVSSLLGAVPSGRSLSYAMSATGYETSVSSQLDSITADLNAIRGTLSAPLIEDNSMHVEVNDATVNAYDEIQAATREYLMLLSRYAEMNHG